MKTTAFQLRVATGVGAVAAVTAISTALAPAAAANPDEWGAIAISDSAKVAGKTWNAPTKAAADSGAMSYCGHSDCKLMVDFRSPDHNCGAVAMSASGYQGGYGATLAEAEKDALTTLGGGSIISWACND
jgi:uncharacterized protein DUF4189